MGEGQRGRAGWGQSLVRGRGRQYEKGTESMIRSLVDIGREAWTLFSGQWGPSCIG